MSESITTSNKEYPKDWNIVKLEEASLNITDGSHFSPKDDKNGDYRIGTVANMTESQIDIDSCKKISKEDYEMLVKNGCKPKIGDVLFSKDGTVGLSFTFKQNDDIVLLSSIAIITPKENLYSDYCACVLKSPFVFKQIEGSKRGTGLRRIILHDLKRFQIPLPPLPEQRRIAEVLGTVDGAIQKVGGAIERTERLKKGLMQRLLTRGIGHEKFKETEVGRVPEEWEVVSIGDICRVVTGGTPSTMHPEYFGGTIKWLKSGDIKELYIYDTEEKITQLGIENSNAKIHPPGTVAIALSGRGQTRGRTAIIKRAMACSQSVAIMIPSSELVAEYLHYNLSNRYLEIRNLTGHYDRSGLNLAIVGNINIPLPPLSEQRRIAEILSAVDRKLELERRRKEKLERVKKGLMNELLTGRKRIKVENDGNIY